MISSSLFLWRRSVTVRFCCVHIFVLRVQSKICLINRTPESPFVTVKHHGSEAVSLQTGFKVVLQCWTHRSLCLLFVSCPPPAASSSSPALSGSRSPEKLTGLLIKTQKCGITNQNDKNCYNKIQHRAQMSRPSTASVSLVLVCVSQVSE